tara:strand:- start:520 stop:1158 length:639 start_codon:yes stop_codon:yes gene_type:complete
MNLPEFSDGNLKRLVICTSIEEIESSDLLDQFPDSKFDHDAQYSKEHWVRLLIEKSERSGEDEDTIHFHIDVVDSFSKNKKAPSSTVDKLFKTASLFYGHTVSAWIKAIYEIPEKEFGKSSVVNAFLGLQTEFAGTRILIDGMHFSVQDDEFDEIEWWKNSDGKIVVEIDANVPECIDKDIVTRATNFLNDGVERFVLGVNENKESESDSDE